MTEQELTVGLKEHLEARIEDLHRLIEYSFAEHEKALTLASKNLDARLDRLNELRETVEDHEHRYATKESYENRMNRVDLDLRELRDAKNRLEGKASQNSVIYAWVMSGTALLASLLGLLIRLIGK